MRRFVFILLCLGFYLADLHAQSSAVYTYHQLSRIYYEKQKDSIKRAWVCPSKYREKSTQKKYKDTWDSRTEFVTTSIDDNDYVYEPELESYLQGIIKEIVFSNNPSVPRYPLLLIDRSAAVNAYAIGNDIIVVNLGLIGFANTREELALVIAHELAHNALSHVENAMLQRAEWLSSDEYKKSLESVMDSKYERYTRLKKVLENYSFSRSRHQRYHESGADSLAIVFLKKAHIPFDAHVFLRLDSSDMVYHQPLQQELGKYFAGYNVPFEEAWIKKRSKGLSTRAYSFSDNTPLADSLKTHPDCEQRYENTKEFADLNIQLTAIPASLKQKAVKMMIWNMFTKGNLTGSLYRILLEKDNGVEDEWYDFMVYNIFARLLYSDKQMKRFTAIGVVQKEYVSANYYELQTMLEQMPTEKLNEYVTKLNSAAFWSKTGQSEQAARDFMRLLLMSVTASEKEVVMQAKDFIGADPNNMYCDFAEQFIKK